MKELTTYTFTTSDYELLSKPFPINPCDLCANDTYYDNSEHSRNHSDSECNDCQRLRDYIKALEIYENNNILDLAFAIHNISHNLTEVLEDLFLISKDLNSINEYVKHASDDSDNLYINDESVKGALYDFFLSQIKYAPCDDNISLSKPDIEEIYDFMNHFYKYYESVKNKIYPEN